MTPATLVDGVAARAAADPGREAIVTLDRRVTYRQLMQAIDAAVGALDAHGIRSGDRVALLARRTPESVAHYYAILAAGAVVVPLDAEATMFEIGGRVGHSGARAVMTDAGLDDRWTAGEADGRQPDGQQPDARLPNDDGSSMPEGLASIVYTSGTTRAPKGVMLTHRNLVSNACAVIEYLRLGPDDRGLSPLPIFYAYGNSVLHTHLLAGATIVFGDMAYPQHTVDHMARERVTGFSGVPWMYATLLARTTFAQGSRAVPTLRYLTQAGAAMPPQDAARLCAAWPGVEFFTMYGLTEATSRLTYLAPEDRSARPGSVGRPIRDVMIEVRRSDGASTAPGEVGEVHASGPNVMPGYWRNPDATRDVLTGDRRGVWLRTGDSGHLDEDGYLYLHGRQAEMVKVAGHRVNPAEVEEVARLANGVADALAFGVPDEQFGEVVHLLVVPDAGAAVAAPAVLAHCRRHLSAYKCPRAVRLVDALPRTASGKVQRLAARQLVEANG
jgi:acyl-CoA synthetase (AMP-forming)/AMP-acid ligase II